MSNPAFRVVFSVYFPIVPDVRHPYLPAILGHVFLRRQSHRHSQSLLIERSAIAEPETAKGIVLSFSTKIIQVLVNRIVGAPVISASSSTPSSIFKQPHHTGNNFLLFFLRRSSIPLLEPKNHTHIFCKVSAADLFGLQPPILFHRRRKFLLGKVYCIPDVFKVFKYPTGMFHSKQFARFTVGQKGIPRDARDLSILLSAITSLLRATPEPQMKLLQKNPL
jgi:hypothetical protein